MVEAQRELSPCFGTPDTFSPNEYVLALSPAARGADQGGTQELLCL